MNKNLIFSKQNTLFGNREVIGFGIDEFYVKKIDRKLAVKTIKKNHYSKKVVNSSFLHLGIFINKEFMGVLQFGYLFNPTYNIKIVKGGHSENAMAIAKHFDSHKDISEVIYPGLANHPQHDLASKQMNGFGGIISMNIKGGLEKSKSFLERTKIFALAESLGGVESLIEHPAFMTHASLPKDRREMIGISDGLVRLSVGLESLDDLIEDIEQALK